MNPNLSRVAVWVNTGTPTVGRTYGTEIVRLLSGHGIETVVLHADEWRSADWPEQVDAHIITGGATPVSAPHTPQANHLIGLARVLASRAHHGGAPVLGICLGAHLLAEAASPGVVRPAQNIEVGMKQVGSPCGRFTSEVAEFHYHQIGSNLIARQGLTLLASNAHSRVQAFRWGSGVYGVQFHPEWSPEVMAEVTDAHAHLIESLSPAPAPLPVVSGPAPAWSPATLMDLLSRVVSRSPTFAPQRTS